MEDQVWNSSLSSTSSRSYISTQRSQLDFFDLDGDEEYSLEFPCPYCSDEFHLVALGPHILDCHPSASVHGVCPVCSARVRADMFGHITQHVNDLMSHLKENNHRDELSYLSQSIKEFQDAHFYDGSGLSPVSTSVMALDVPLLSFLHHTPAVDNSEELQPTSSSEVSLEEEDEEDEEGGLKSTLLESVHDPPPSSKKDQEERALRSKFVQGLILSSFLDDDL